MRRRVHDDDVFMGVTFNENTFVKLGPIFNENVGAVQIFHREAAMFSVNVNAVASLHNSDSFYFNRFPGFQSGALNCYLGHYGRI